jgi:lipid A 3-O-deacylase
VPNKPSAIRRAASLSLLAMAGAAAPSAAQAGELFGGVYVHDVKLPTDKSGIEGGADLQLGYRGGSILNSVGAVLQPYIFGALNTAGETNYAAAGIAIRFSLGKVVYVRPGLGIAVHTGSAGRFFRNDKIAFGSRVLFEPELGIGAKLNDRLSMEASWVHMSHATLFSRENPGIDNLGVRLNLAL